ncbi:flagellar hook-length control protein FliK [Sphingomonas quercus]|uniref:Flagellar hook-length control protein FliK n=1 Tax=Sphingomonas quercus TaxID=2842451 RepID=A0ABS6BK48_9SPHN|nr:flagellar hook-length control protein FliK [Sphingomonas quercus]MBU3078673.1 flagellar hook-length control protein FliK [Sphingomonas quercus]
MSIPSIVSRSPAPAPVRPADNGSSAAGSAFGAMVDDNKPAAAPVRPSQQAQQQEPAADKTAADRPAGATAKADKPAPADATNETLEQAVAEPAVEAPPLPDLPAGAAEADPIAPTPGELALGDDAANTLAGSLADDAVKPADPTLPATPPAPVAATKPIQTPALAQQAAAADAIVEQPLAAATAGIAAPKPAAPAKKQDSAAAPKADTKADPAQATAAATAAALPMPVVAPQQAVAATVAQDEAPPADAALPGLSGALSRTAAKGEVAASPTADADTGAAAPAARDAGPAVQTHQLAQGGLSSTLLAQSVPADTKPASFGTVYAANLAQTSTEAAHATVAAQTGRIGHDMGVEIARSVAAGRHEILVRLDPPEMGRIEVRMSFDKDGGLRAVVAADNHGALDLLKRDSADLVRALSDAGVRSDSQSFRFDSRSGDGGQQWRQAQQDGTNSRGSAAGGADGLAEDEPAYRQLRTSGRIDMMA